MKKSAKGSLSFMTLSALNGWGRGEAVAGYKTDEEYLRNPRLPFVKTGVMGNKWKQGRFQNEYTINHAPLMDVLRWKLSSNPQRKEKKRDTFSLTEVPSSDFLNSSEDSLIWLGHASFLIRLNGVTFLTDPCFYDLPFIERQSSFPSILHSLPSLDHVLISHAHHDHFDKESIEYITRTYPDVEALLPLKVDSLYNEVVKVPKSQTAAWYQQFQTKDKVEVIFLPSFHWYRRSLFDFNELLWGSFLIRANGKSIYFAGDTAYSPHFKEVRSAIGPVDVCLIPIGAYKPAYMMKTSHVDPVEAVRAAGDMEASLTIPMHFGTYDLSDEPLGEPIELFNSEAQKYGLPIKTLNLGEVFYF